jgi:molecular chaperone GrpE
MDGAPDTGVDEATAEEAAADEPVVEAEVVEEAGAPAEAGPDAPPEEPDYKDRWMRTAADLENVRRRSRRDVALAEGKGIARLARELLPALDNLDRALAAAEAQPENADHHLTDGIRLVQAELQGALERVGITQDSPVGQPFDPHVHEAVAQQPAAEGVEPGTVVEVFSPGYRIGDEVLRAAKVVVAG